MGDLDDEYILEFGKYKGWKLGGAPAEYLLEILNNGEAKGALKKYIEEVKHILEDEVKAKLN